MGIIFGVPSKTFEGGPEYSSPSPLRGLAPNTGSRIPEPLGKIPDPNGKLGMLVRDGTLDQYWLAQQYSANPSVLGLEDWRRHPHGQSMMQVSDLLTSTLETNQVRVQKELLNSRRTNKFIISDATNEKTVTLVPGSGWFYDAVASRRKAGEPNDAGAGLMVNNQRYALNYKV